MRRAGISSLLLLTLLAVLGSTNLLFALAVGEKAPDFTLPATTQEKWSLSNLIGKKNVVLFSFIGAFTPT